MAEIEPAALEVCRQIEFLGPAPSLTKWQIDRLAREWPPFALALAELMRSCDRPVPHAWTHIEGRKTPCTHSR